MATNTPKKLPLKEFKKIYKKVPRMCIDVIVKTSKGIILTKRDIAPDRGKWHVPGGTVLLGERFKDAIDRIAQEELGLAVKSQKLLGVVEFVGRSPFMHAVSIAYLVKPMSGKLRGSWQGSSVKYFKKIPVNMVKEQSKFLKDKRILS